MADREVPLLKGEMAGEELSANPLEGGDEVKLIFEDVNCSKLRVVDRKVRLL